MTALGRWMDLLDEDGEEGSSEERRHRVTAPMPAMHLAMDASFRFRLLLVVCEEEEFMLGGSESFL